MNNKPRISIVTVTYNALPVILSCLESVAKQTLECEHIIIDGMSTDGTKELLETYTNHRVSVLSEPDDGIYDAMNKGIQLATGEIVGLLNADDIYPTCFSLERVAQIFENPAIDACYGDLCYVTANDLEKVVRYWKAGSYNPRKFYWGWMPPHPTFFVRKRFYKELGGYNNNLSLSADYELMLRFILKNYLRVCYIPQVQVHMRVGGISNKTFNNRLMANKQDRMAWMVNDLRPYPWTVMFKPLRKISQWFSRP